MDGVQQWTGREAGLLRQALRLSHVAFAAHLGVSPRAVANWESRGAKVIPRPEMQAMLDTALARADQGAQRRFAISKDAGAARSSLERGAQPVSVPNLIEDGYWTDSFAKRVLGDAERRVVVFVWRNSRILSVEILEVILERLKANKELQIDIFALSVDASSEVCSNVSRMLRLADPQQISREQLHHRNVARSVLAKQLRDGHLTEDESSRLSYLEYSVMPHMHCVIVDDAVFWGINFIRDPALGASDLLSRACLESSTHSDFGQKVLEQIALVKGISTHVDLFRVLPEPESDRGEWRLAKAKSPKPVDQ